MKELPKLKGLWLRGVDISDTGIVHLSVHIGLEELEIYGSISDDGVAELSGLRNLKRLNLQGKEITDASVSVLAGFSELVELDLFGTSITSEGRECLREILPNCQIKPESEFILINSKIKLTPKDPHKQEKEISEDIEDK